MKPIIGLTMGSDIIDEIEKYLSKFRKSDNDLKLHLAQVDTVDPSISIGASSGASFNKTWCKLGLPEKLNRLMRYLTKVQHKLSLDSKKTEELRKFFYENVNTSLASDEYVSYDPVEADIVTIIGLKYGENEFYLQTHAAPKPEGVRVKQRVFSNISQLLSTIDNATSPAPVPDPALDPAPVPPANPQLPLKKMVVVKKKN